MRVLCGSWEGGAEAECEERERKRKRERERERGQKGGCAVEAWFVLVDWKGALRVVLAKNEFSCGATRFSCGVVHYVAVGNGC